MMHGFGWGGFGGFGGLGWIGLVINLVLSLLVIIGVIWLVVWAVRRLTQYRPGSAFPAGQGSGSPSARDILQARYARGEISREEYQQMLQDIS